ncbi:hypothetical protein [Cohnella abietis]|uniref:Sulfotransferase domain-containing protein n=1 Tax=Cohnella abietis TaxID=2507935 RepID=A0A3T1D5T6_9BACL|nr:hypothetical protein [Cohnella abietis]BBI33315.1 hypothetical protein KCTCHS21_27140 [Cohnella abietis]
MKTIYVYIGMASRDTTLIQDFLSINHEALKENDIFFPVDKNKSYVLWNQHVPLVTAITGESIPTYVDKEKYINKNILAEFINDIEDTTEKNILISSDWFSSLFQKTHIISLKKLFKNYNVKIIVYLRRQDDFIISNFQQAVREGEYFDISLERMVGFEDAKYYQTIRTWIKVFGEKNVNIRIFNENECSSDDFYSDFLNLIGVNLQNTQLQYPSNTQNQTISYEKALFLNKLSHYLVPIDDINNEKRVSHHEIRNFVINSHSNHVGELNNFLSSRERVEIMKSFSKDNEKTAKKLLKRKDGVLFDDSSFNLEQQINYKKELTDEEFIEKLVVLAEEMFIMQNKIQEKS